MTETGSAAVRLGVLGPVAVRDDAGAWTEIVGQRPKALLVGLALAAPHAVSAEHLIDEIWGDDPPSGARAALQTLISRVRAAHRGLVLESTAAGYRLAGGADVTDSVWPSAHPHTPAPRWIGAARPRPRRVRLRLRRG